MITCLMNFQIQHKCRLIYLHNETIVQGNAAEKLNGSNSNNLNSNALGLFSFYKQYLKQGNNNSRAMSGYSPCQMSRHKIHIKKKLKK